jgi:hypothetical protein
MGAAADRDASAGQVDGWVERVRDALAGVLRNGGDPRLEAVAAADCYLVGSYADGRAGPGSDLDVLAFTGEESGIEGVIAPLAQGRRPGPGESLPTLAEVMSWRATDALRNMEIELVGPRGRASRETDLSFWAFQMEPARLLHAGWGGGEAYRAEIAERFEAVRPGMASSSLVEFQHRRNQAQTALLHGQPLAIMLTSALAVRAAMRSWLLWAGRPLPSDKWLPSVTAARADSAPLMALVESLLDPDHPAERRFQDLRTLRQLLDEHVRGAGGDPGALWT